MSALCFWSNDPYVSSNSKMGRVRTSFWIFLVHRKAVLNVIFWPILKGENILLGRPSQFTTKFTLIMNFCVVFYGKYRMDFLVGDFNAS